MKQGESKLSSQILRALRADGVFAFKVHGGAMMMAGLPDIIACVDGKFVGLETKMPDKRGNVSPRQEYVHAKIRDSGGTVFIVTSIREARDAVAQVRA